MGTLFTRNDIYYDNDPDSFFEDALCELREIINGSTLEKKSPVIEEKGFEVDLIKTAKEKIEEKCKLINKAFLHKRFEPIQDGENWNPICRNYFDKIDVVFRGRVEMNLNMPEARRLEIFERFNPHYNEYLIPGFKNYWNHHKGLVYLYIDSKHSIWKNKADRIKEYELIRDGIDQMILFLRKFI